jgi:D-galacturonate reductase
MVTKPIVMTLEHHRILHEEAQRTGVLVAVEVHKRWDLIYGDAHDRIQNLGSFSYLLVHVAAEASARHLPRLGRQEQ